MALSFSLGKQRPADPVQQIHDELLDQDMSSFRETLEIALAPRRRT